jgi:deazaflavin-dependent oxidoreductase (nitroreductase family)
MPVPQWVAKINKRLFNPMEIRRGKRPVITHSGRSSGKTYHTPLDAHRTEDGFVFILMYTSACDWVQNVVAAGSAKLSVNGEEFDLVSPRLITMEEAAAVVSPETNLQPGRVKGIEYLQMDIRQ